MKHRSSRSDAASEAVPSAEPSGTFARIYAVVRQIPAGSAATYGQIARLAGMPRCARVVGYALASCRDKTVPCHRVVGSDSSLTGYAGGLEKKRYLLSLEGIDVTTLSTPTRGTAL